MQSRLCVDANNESLLLNEMNDSLVFVGLAESFDALPDCFADAVQCLLPLALTGEFPLTSAFKELRR